MKPITVLSLFDGMACGLVALKRAGIPIKNYYSSEIDPAAIKVAKDNHPEIIHLGSVENWEEWNIESPDLVIGGSPCQGFSFAGKQLAFEDPRSRLFFTMMDIIYYYNPRFRLLENVKMKQSFLDIITERMGVDPLFINSSLVSAQNRQRYYWFNWSSSIPVDKEISFLDIKELPGKYTAAMRGRYLVNGKRLDGKIKTKGLTKQYIEFRKDQKTNALTTVSKDNVITNRRPNGRVLANKIGYRFLSILEKERLQTLDDDYTAAASKTQREIMIGNGWTVDVIAHLFKSLKEVL